MDGEGGVKGVVRREEIPNGPQADGQHQPQQDQIVPMVLLKAVGHALQKGRHQIDGDKGIQEPVGHQHRVGEEIEQQGPGGLRPLLEALQGDDHQRPHHQRHRHLGQAAAEEGGQLPGALLPQQQGPGEHEEQRHRRRGQG